jgi:hypothetical protein
VATASDTEYEAISVGHSLANRTMSSGSISTGSYPARHAITGSFLMMAGLGVLSVLLTELVLGDGLEALGPLRQVGVALHPVERVQVGRAPGQHSTRLVREHVERQANGPLGKPFPALRRMGASPGAVLALLLRHADLGRHVDAVDLPRARAPHRAQGPCSKGTSGAIGALLTFMRASRNGQSKKSPL